MMFEIIRIAFCGISIAMEFVWPKHKVADRMSEHEHDLD
jgi:hypothetical protein